MYCKVNLVGRDDAAVATVMVPAMQIAPECYLWGDRVFLRVTPPGPSADGDVYREVNHIVVAEVAGVTDVRGRVIEEKTP